MSEQRNGLNGWTKWIIIAAFGLIISLTGAWGLDIAARLNTHLEAPGHQGTLKGFELLQWQVNWLYDHFDGPIPMNAGDDK